MNVLSWIYAARPKTLVASMVPVISGTLIIPNSNMFKLDIFLFTIIAAIIIQVVTNYINDLHDFLKGADKDRVGPIRMIQSGMISQFKIKQAISILIIIGILCGIPLVIEGGWPIIIIGLSSFLFAYLYTAGPYPLAYHGLGDIFVFIYFGIIAVGGTYYLQTGFIDENAIYLGIAIGANNIILLAINNLRDYQTDKNANKKTLIVLFGKKFGKIEILSMLLLSYISFFLLSKELNNYNLFYSIIFSIPLALNIIYDIYNLSGEKLNNTLPKIASLLILQCILLGIAIYI